MSGVSTTTRNQAPGHKRKDPATKGAAILNLVSGVLNVVTATVRLIAVMLHVGL